LSWLGLSDGLLLGLFLLLLFAFGVEDSNHSVFYLDHVLFGEDHFDAEITLGFRGSCFDVFLSLFEVLKQNSCEKRKEHNISQNQKT
jgi:hypothetical protein